MTHQLIVPHYGMPKEEHIARSTDSVGAPRHATALKFQRPSEKRHALNSGSRIANVVPHRKKNLAGAHAPHCAVPTMDSATADYDVLEPVFSPALQVLKSIVYGGLTEAIMSLSIVSSAAASDATTLNVVALAVANLIGGILISGPNLWNLKHGQVLGRREYFPLHATLALLSFLIFGLIPPAVYGFTFRESDDKDFKLLAVAVVSLLGISLLASAKAYISGQHKFSSYIKTVACFLVTAAAASGASYAVGDQTKQLMEKLG